MDHDDPLDRPAMRSWALKFCSRRCSDLSEKELLEAADSLIGYFKVMRGVYERMTEDGRIEAFRRRLEGYKLQEALGEFVLLLLWRAEQLTHAAEPQNC